MTKQKKKKKLSPVYGLPQVMDGAQALGGRWSGQQNVTYLPSRDNAITIGDGNLKKVPGPECTVPTAKYYGVSFKRGHSKEAGG